MNEENYCFFVYVATSQLGLYIIEDMILIN